MYWYWYWYLYWYLDHWYWYWYWYLFVEYLIQDCFLVGRPSLVEKAFKFHPCMNILSFFSFLSILRAQQPRRGWPSNVFRRFGGVTARRVQKFAKLSARQTRKRGNCECIATWGYPSHASPFSALITTSCTHAKFEVAEPIHCRISVRPTAVDTLLYAVPWPLTPWPWSLTLTFAAHRHMAWWNPIANLNVIGKFATELLRFQYLTLWPWTCVACCARLSDNFHQVWHSTTYTCLMFYVDTLCHAVTLTFDLLTLNVL